MSIPLAIVNQRSLIRLIDGNNKRSRTEPKLKATTDFYWPCTIINLLSEYKFKHVLCYANLGLLE